MGVTLDLAIGASGFEQQIVNRAQLVTIADTESYVSPSFMSSATSTARPGMSFPVAVSPIVNSP